MVSDSPEPNDISWLKSNMQRELDLRPPSLASTNQTSKIIRDEHGNPIAHVAVSNRWQGSEINSLVVDPAHRGKGLSHQLLARVTGARLFCYTRDERLQSALTKAGYKRAKFLELVLLQSATHKCYLCLDAIDIGLQTILQN